MKKSNIFIRDAILKDLNEIHNIEKESSNLWNKKLFADEFNIDFSNIYIAQFKDEIAGFIVIWDIENEIQLNNIAVKNKYRRLGIGNLLLNHITEKTYKKQKQIILLELDENNLKAKNFYLKNNFNVSGIRKNYYSNNNNAILMEKNISSGDINK
jgi:[ribosomal protein S18]-alanine N-acetyltransferase